MYVDDGISGAEFANRPGFLRLMNALKPRPPFQVLVMSEESRLGREAIETAYALKQLVQAGVRVFFYLEDRERTLDSPTDKIMLSLTAFADELEREKARQRTYDAMLRKAKAGHVTGGRVLRLRQRRGARRGRQALARRAADQRRRGRDRPAHLRAVAQGARAERDRQALNAEGAPAPRSQQARPRAWAPSSVREILYRAALPRRDRLEPDAEARRLGPGSAERQALQASGSASTAPELRIVSEDAVDARPRAAGRVPRDVLSAAPRGSCGAGPRAAWSRSTCCRVWRGAGAAAAACTSRAGATARGAPTSTAARPSTCAVVGLLEQSRGADGPLRPCRPGAIERDVLQPDVIAATFGRHLSG